MKIDAVDAVNMDKGTQELLQTWVSVWGIMGWSLGAVCCAVCKPSVRLSTSDNFLHSSRPFELISILSVWFHIRHTPFPFCLGASAGSTEPAMMFPFPVNVIPALIVFPQQYLCRLFLPRTNSKHVCLWSGVPGRTVIYSLNREFVLAGKKISEVPGRDQVSVIPWARRRLSGSPGGENSWEENNVSMWMPVKCVSWWESMFSVKSRHNKQWLKAYKQTD